MVLRGLGLVIGWVPLVLLNYKGSAEPRHRCLCQCGNRPHWHSIVPDHMLSSHRHPAGPYPAESSGDVVQGVTQSWHGRLWMLAWSGGVCGLIVAWQGGILCPQCASASGGTSVGIFSDNCAIDTLINAGITIVL